MRWTKACTIESSAKLIRGPRIPTGGNTVRLGAHVSISESIALAPVRGRSVGCETIQIFSRSPRMLRKTKPIPPEEAKAFQDNMAKGGLFRAVIHANYLINLSSSTKNGLRYSRVAFVRNWIAPRFWASET